MLLINILFQIYFLSVFMFFFSAERKITHLFPIQAQTFDHVYDGLDVIARASK